MFSSMIPIFVMYLNVNWTLTFQIYIAVSYTHLTLPTT